MVHGTRIKIMVGLHNYGTFWQRCILSKSILGIERNRTGPNQLNAADDSTHRLDFRLKIDEQ